MTAKPGVSQQPTSPPSQGVPDSDFIQSYNQLRERFQRTTNALASAAAEGRAKLNEAAERKKAEVVSAPDAKDHVGKRCTVEMTVRSSKNAAPRRPSKRALSGYLNAIVCSRSGDPLTTCS